MSRRIRHQASHACELLDLLIGTTRSGIRHHEDVVVLIEPRHQIFRELLIRLLPGLDDLLVALLIRRKSAAVVAGDLLDRRLCLRDEALFGLRHSHI